MSTDKAVLPFIGSGVKQDLNMLYNKFLATESERIRDFATVFREMRFETILHYRMTPSEYVEFAEYLLQKAALYISKWNEVHGERSRMERIFGIYACYSLYNLQPKDHVCQILITQVQFQEMTDFKKELTAEKLLEPVAALTNLILKKAFRLTVFQSTYDPATHKRYLAEEEMPESSQQAIEPFAVINELLSHQTFGELMYIHNAYTEAKKNLNLSQISMVDKLNPKEEFEKRLEKHRIELKKALERISEADGVEKADDSIQDSSSRSVLKNKAYKAAMHHTRQRRYLDPNMEDNFQIKTFGEIAQEAMEDTAQPGPSTKRAPKRKRRPTVQIMASVYTDQELAEKTIQDEYAARTKPEEDNVTIEIGGKISKAGTSSIAKIRAPPKNKKINLVEMEKFGPTSSDACQASTSDISPESSLNFRKLETKPRISDEWANKLQAWNGQLEATEKQLKKLTNRIKIEPGEPE